MTAEQPTSRRSAVIVVAAVVAVFAATAIAHVWTHLRVIEYGYRISKATRARDALLERNRRLRVDLAVLKSPARVAAVVAERGGLRPADPRQVRRIRAGDGTHSQQPQPTPSSVDGAASPAVAVSHSPVRGTILTASPPLRIALGTAGGARADDSPERAQ